MKKKINRHKLFDWCWFPIVSIGIVIYTLLVLNVDIEGYINGIFDTLVIGLFYILGVKER